MAEWIVQVNGVGVIGKVEVVGDNDVQREFYARQAAQIRFGKTGPRPKKETLPSPCIYEDDDFAVIKL